jgi:hypothetical protein
MYINLPQLYFPVFIPTSCDKCYNYCFSSMRCKKLKFRKLLEAQWGYLFWQSLYSDNLYIILQSYQSYKGGGGRKRKIQQKLHQILDQTQKPKPKLYKWRVTVYKNFQSPAVCYIMNDFSLFDEVCIKYKDTEHILFKERSKHKKTDRGTLVDVLKHNGPTN